MTDLLSVRVCGYKTKWKYLSYGRISIYLLSPYIWRRYDALLMSLDDMISAHLEQVDWPGLVDAPYWFWGQGHSDLEYHNGFCSFNHLIFQCIYNNCSLNTTLIIVHSVLLALSTVHWALLMVSFVHWVLLTVSNVHWTLLTVFNCLRSTTRRVMFTVYDEYCWMNSTHSQ